MKEVMAIIRVGKVNPTKDALINAGFPAFVCRACLGRGKKALNPELLKYVLDTEELPVSNVGESITEGARLISKRFFTMIVEDHEVEAVVKTLIKINQTGNPGDGKIFILPVLETYKVRTGETVL
ncbi:MAG: nitrogen regulatory protein [Bacillota bacterium]|jgi:nitrogen regulatory protein PII 2|uniref:P-II family nitrogen regulator n=1 Tax=Anoxybacterium hadale TaxID=3408580 RepID=A0ACD1AE63_9FIRM|nr:nitrogen regulatory protein [Bacillota bacterium]QOX64823.1 P-II family nitrogen regulator [Clostridiales bacterium]